MQDLFDKARSDINSALTKCFAEIGEASQRLFDEMDARRAVLTGERKIGVAMPDTKDGPQMAISAAVLSDAAYPFYGTAEPHEAPKCEDCECFKIPWCLARGDDGDIKGGQAAFMRSNIADLCGPSGAWFKPRVAPPDLALQAVEQAINDARETG